MFRSQQQLRRCQSELNKQVKQSSSVIQEKVPFNDTSKYFATELRVVAGRALAKNINVFAADTITTFSLRVNSVMLH